MASSKVKNMISLYENFTYSHVNNESSKLSQKQRTKSVGNIPVSQTHSQEYKSKSEVNLELIQIEQQVHHLTNTLNNYKTYSRENHIYYQNQIFFLLTDIIKVETRDDPIIINKKSELIEVLKRLNVGLNSRLPSAAKKMQMEVSVPKSPEVKKEEEQVKPNEQKEVMRQETREELGGGDTPAPSVKSLKQLWEKNINESEKEKPKENKPKMSELYLKLNGSVDDYKYVPFGERFTKQNSEEFNNLNETMIVPETPLDFYEQSVLFKTDEEPRSLTSDTHSSQSDDGSEGDFDFQEREDFVENS